EDVVADTWYAALLTGVALGVKVNAAPAALIVLAMMMVRARGGASTAYRGRHFMAATVAIFAISWAATAGYWYARNILNTGPPLSPAASVCGPARRFPETTPRGPGSHYGLRRALTDASDVYLNWPVLHATLGILGLAGLAGTLAFKRGALARPARYVAWGS